MPIDTTPGYYYDAVTLRDMVDTPDNVHKTAALEDSRIDVSPVTKPDNNSGLFTDPVGTAINAANLLLGIVAALVLLLTVLFLLFEIARGVIYMTEIKKFRSAKNQERILFLGRKILCYLRLWNIEASIGWNTAEVDAAIVNAFPNIEPGSYTRVCELLEKAVAASRLRCMRSARYGAFWSTSSRRTRIQASKRALSCTTQAFCTRGLPARKKHSLRIKSILIL